MRKSTKLGASGRPSIGIVVDAGPSLGFEHAVRCVRLGRALEAEADLVYFPLSEACETFLHNEVAGADIRKPKSAIDCPVVISDIREPHQIKAQRLISIHDLGLGQCSSDVVIDGSITRVFAYPNDKGRNYFVGPEYMITRAPVRRCEPQPTVLVAFGTGGGPRTANDVADSLVGLGLNVVTTTGLSVSTRTAEADLNRAISTCVFAVSSAGAPLYDLLASRVPTIAVSVNRLQFRTARAFQEQGAVMNAGMADSLSAETLLGYCVQMLKDPSLATQLAARGQQLVDGKGLSRVIEIVRKVGKPRQAGVTDSTRRKQLWLKPTTMYTNC